MSNNDVFLCVCERLTREVVQNVKHEATGKHAQKDAAELAALLERTNLELTHKVKGPE